MPGQFNDVRNITMSAVGAYAVTPNDSTDLTQPCRSVTLNAGGTLSFVSSVDGATYTTGALPAGSYPVLASRIRSTGTTATGITAWI
jgi:hypothetical protein